MNVGALTLALLLFLFVFGSLTVWAIVFDRLRRRQPLLPYEPRSAVPWTGQDLLIIVLLVLLAYLAAPLAASAQRAWQAEPHDQVAPLDLQEPAPNDKSPNVEAPLPAPRPLRITPLVAAIQAVATLGVCALIAFGLRHITGASWRDLGLVSPHLGRDALLGLCGMLAIAIPVYTIQGLMTTVFGFPSEHPLLKLLESQPSAWNLLLSLGLAVLVAPFVEEFVFRVLLQGWLEAQEDRWRQLYPAILGRIPWGVVPVAASALLFALLHGSQGPDPVALFPLALVFGYLYRQTHRVWPSAFMHLCFNGLSLIILWLAIASGATP
jgi:membrane protease YdiL (CAAX protease family)